MSEIDKMTLDLLADMEDMTPEQIEQIRTEWFDKMEREDKETTFRVGEFINVLCDVAINRAKKIMQTA